MHKSLVSLLIIFGANHGVVAANNDPELDYFSEIPVVLSATRLSQNVDRAPASVTVIDRKMIEASGARTVPDLFRLVPGFLVVHERGNKLVVSYHGLTDKYSRRMQVLVDGRSVYIPSFAGVPWESLNLSIEDIYKIEVIRGPNAASYGANSFLSVINIHTYSGNEVPGNTISTLVKDIHDHRITYRAAGNRKNYEYRITAETDRDDIFSMMNDKRVTNKINTRLDYRLSANSALLFQAGVLSGLRADGFPNSASNTMRNVDTDSHFFQVRWNKYLGPEDDYYIQLYHNRNDENDHFINPNFGGGPILINFDTRSDRWDLEFQHRTRLNPETRLVWGLNTRYDTLKAEGYIIDASKTVYRMNRIFSNLEWFINQNLSTNIGVMLEDNNFTGFSNSPRLAFNYSLSKNNSIRAIYSKAYRVPSIVEEKGNAQFWLPHLGIYYPIFFGSNDLKSEQIISREIGYYGVFNKTAKLDIKIFRDNITNLIALTVPSAPAYFLNTDDATLKGIEVQLDLTPDKYTRFAIAYSRVKATSSDIQDNFSTSVPTHTFSILGSHNITHNITANFAFYHMGRYQPIDGDLYDHFKRFDFSVYRSFKTGKYQGKIGLVAQNVLGDIVEYRPQNIFKDAYFLNLELKQKR